MHIAKDNRVSFDMETGKSVPISRLTNTKGTKECIREGCNNTVVNHINKKYCSDPRCVAEREMVRKQRSVGKPRVAHIHSPTINVVIPRTSQLAGKILTIQCGARGNHGRCKNTFNTPYSMTKTRYPKYCEEHRNEFKRKRWETK